MGQATTIHNLSWFGEEGKEAISMSNGDYLLLEYDNKKIINLGNEIVEAKEKLKKMSKDKNFPDFMNQ